MPGGCYRETATTTRENISCTQGTPIQSSDHHYQGGDLEPCVVDALIVTQGRIRDAEWDQLIINDAHPGMHIVVKAKFTAAITIYAERIEPHPNGQYLVGCILRVLQQQQVSVYTPWAGFYPWAGVFNTPCSLFAERRLHDH